jgi:hypothetical protein
MEWNAGRERGRGGEIYNCDEMRVEWSGMEYVYIIVCRGEGGSRLLVWYGMLRERGMRVLL